MSLKIKLYQNEQIKTNGHGKPQYSYSGNGWN